MGRIFIQHTEHITKFRTWFVSANRPEGCYGITRKEKGQIMILTLAVFSNKA